MKSGEFDKKTFVENIKRIVVKIGSAVIADADKGLNSRRILALVEEIIKLKEKKYEFVLVTSGAIAAGKAKLQLGGRPFSLQEKQAAAAVGQCTLIRTYERVFEQAGIVVGQILLTHDDLSSRKRYLNAINTIHALLNCGAVPVINENDTVSVDEIKFGDNDFLAAAVSSMIETDLLVLLTDVDGIEDRRQPAERNIIRVADAANPAIYQMIDSTTGSLGTGGMISKVQAARKAAHSGVATLIANGKRKNAITDFLAGEEIGTVFLPKIERLKRRKHWIGFTVKSRGKIIVDSGAREALTDKGKSLLPSGIIAIEGSFSVGDSVLLVDGNGNSFAKGLVNYNSIELAKIKGKKTADIIHILGKKDYDEAIHRDNLVIISE
ncbi:MAG: glutamate 5-kinase [Candidatus Schekmanbacteria bacterium]|nr:glutamate 5-kinase [Candidatus Schekmanbacteria bacterium]